MNNSLYVDGVESALRSLISVYEDLSKEDQNDMIIELNMLAWKYNEKRRFYREDLVKG